MILLVSQRSPSKPVTQIQILWGVQLPPFQQPGKHELSVNNNLI